MASSMHLSRLRRWIVSSPPIEWALKHSREILIAALRQGPIPQHVAFVMDGNRRFARRHGIERVEGHNLGFEALANILEVCYKAGVKVVTIYAFSIENFKRSKYEVDALMEMIKVKLSQLSEHGELLDRYGVSIRVLGRRELVRSDVLEAVDRAMEITSRNGNAILNVCFPYTARDEITTAVQNTVIDYSTPLDRTQVQASSGRRPFSQSHIAQSIRETSPSAGRPEDSSGSGSGSDDATASDTNGGDASPDSQSSSFSSTTTLHPVLQQSPSASVTKLTTVPEIFSSYPPNSDQLIFRSSETITAQTLNDHMLTHDNPPLDLLIRTSGVSRLSDFMLWQSHQNTHIVFLDTLWPAFGLRDFLPVLWEWQRRIRKQGVNLSCEYESGDELEDGVSHSGRAGQHAKVL